MKGASITFRVIYKQQQQKTHNLKIPIFKNYDLQIFLTMQPTGKIFFVHVL